MAPGPRVRYRTRVCVYDAPARFGEFAAGHGVRTPTQTVQHMTGLMDFARAILTGAERPEPQHRGTWSEALEALVHALADLDAAIAGTHGWHGDANKALQGLIADALTHTGQIGDAAATGRRTDRRRPALRDRDPGG